jgi:putative hydrolase of HD superfamily
MSDELIRFFEIAAKLKTLDRAGWRRCGVDPCESVAEHTFGVALLALLTPADGINREHCVALALVHDLAESIVGDLTPHDPIGPDEKHRRELDAMTKLSQTLGQRRVLELWEEFETAQTPEAMLVRDLDVIEMAAQARAYERDGKLAPDAAAGFVDSARRRVTTDAGRRLLDSVLRGG